MVRLYGLPSGVGKYSSYYSGQGVNENIYQGTFFKYHKTAWAAERYAAGQKITYPRLSTGETCSKIENDFFVMDVLLSVLKQSNWVILCRRMLCVQSVLIN